MKSILQHAWLTGINFSMTGNVVKYQVEFFAVISTRPSKVNGVYVIMWKLFYYVKQAQNHLTAEARQYRPGIRPTIRN